MKAISSSSEGTMHKGKCYDVGEAQATAMVEGGYAEYETVMIAVKKPQDKEDRKAALEAVKKIEAETPKKKTAKKATTKKPW